MTNQQIGVLAAIWGTVAAVGFAGLYHLMNSKGKRPTTRAGSGPSIGSEPSEAKRASPTSGPPGVTLIDVRWPPKFEETLKLLHLTLCIHLALMALAFASAVLAFLARM